MIEVVLEQFLEEARELLAEASKGLVALERAPTDAPLVNTVFRAFHTMKGSSALFDFRPMTRALHAAEDLLHSVREGHDALTPDKADVLFAVLDQASAWLSALANGRGLDADADAQADALVARARAVGGEHVASTVQASRPEEELPSASEVPGWVKLAGRAPEYVGRALVGIEYDPEPGCFFTGDDPLRLMSLIPELVSLRVTGVDTLRGQTAQDAYQCAVGFRAVTASPISEVRTLFAYVANQVKLYEFSVGLGAEVEGCARLLREVIVSLRAEVPANIAAARRASQALMVRRTLLASGFPKSWLEAFDSGAARAMEASSDALLRTAIERVLGTVAAAGRCGMRVSMLPGAHKMAQLSAPPIRASLEPRAALREAVPVPVVVMPADEVAPLEIVEPSARAFAEPVVRSKADAQANSQVYKVDQSRIDALLDLAGELLVAKNALPYLARRAETAFEAPALAREIKEQAGALNRIADSFHHAVMQLRIIPLSHVFERFPRLVRDLTRQLGKQVRFEVEGAATEADKSTVEKLADPLIHILRNSLDHGLETPEQRAESGKPPEGLLRLTAYQERGALIVSVRDDGRGIDPTRIRETAVMRNVLSPHEAAQLSDDDALNLIFRAGFSTKEQISDLSGRGVGMDVVQTTLRACNGSVRVTSKVGAGTDVTLTLPLSMAVTRVLLVETAGQTFGIPFELVAESVHVSPDRIAAVKGIDVVTIRDQVVPLAHLDALLGLRRVGSEASEPALQTVLLVRLPSGDIGLVVQAVHEAVDVMLKPLDGPLASLPSYLGASLLGDGRALLVLSLPHLMT